MSHVTNSSSSSFILGFKDENSIAQELADDNTYGNFERIYNDCKKANKLSLDEMIQYYSENIKWDIRYDIESNFDQQHYRKYGKYMSWADISKIRNSEEFTKLCSDELNRRIKIIISEAEDDNVFVLVEYDDHLSSELEHEIVPNLNCCLLRISHH